MSKVVQGARCLFEGTLQPRGTYRADIVLESAVPLEGITWKLRAGEEVVQRRFLSKGDTKKFVFFVLPDDIVELSMCFEDAANHPVEIEISSLSLTPVRFHHHENKFEFTSASIVACMASYPARKHMLKQAVETLINQVDHLFLYLNGYEELPEYIVELARLGKLTYLETSENTLRASGKFWWLGNPGYFLLCDDDILYPPNYAYRMVSQLNRLGRSENVLGAHGKRFRKEDGKTVDAWFTRFPEFQRNLEPCHLLGTGVLAVHASALEDFNILGLLNHPIDNDEAFAVEALRTGLSLWTIPREKAWIQSNPNMKYGLLEEVSLYPAKNEKRISVLQNVRHWPNHSDEPPKRRLDENSVLQRFTAAVSDLAKRRLEKGGSVPSFVQIGACDGISYDPFHELIMQHDLPGVLFEPLPHLFDRLRRTYKKRDDLVFINMAVTETGGMQDIRYVSPYAISKKLVPEWAIGIASLKENVNALDEHGAIDPKITKAIKRYIRVCRVPCVAFDEMAQWSITGKADIFVSDTEGYDIYYMNRIAAGKIRPEIIFSEILLLNDRELEDIWRKLTRAGYAVYCGGEHIFATL
jgi:Methyltransferase FkbM domain